MSNYANTPPLLAVGDLELEYRYLPRGARPTLVLLHEGLGCCALWRDFPERLQDATDLPVWLYSRAGYGRSSPIRLPRPLDFMTREAELLPAILDAAGIAECILVGHSDGASIALVNAGKVHDPRVRGIVLMAPHVMTEPMGLASIAAARAAYESGDLRARLAKYHGANVDCAFRGWSGAWLDPDFVRWSLEHYVDDIEVPVLLIQGVDDQYGTPEQLRRIERRLRVPFETALLDDCRHAPQFDQSARTLESIAAFVARVRAG
ncbi:MAG: alpha/beta hydrolase [Gammaproteobacteria bacterium]|nr:alpha/beta hydrolase [Gammaproteobacteria bacterium]